MESSPPTQERMEAGLLGSLEGSLDRWLALSKKGLTSSDFTFHRDVFDFISEYLPKYGSVPTSQQIGLRYAELQPPPGDFAYWLDELSKRVFEAKLLQAMEAADSTAVADPYRAADELVNSILQLRASQADNVQAIDANIEARFGSYLNRREYLDRGGLLGIKTGIEVIDQTRQGWMPGELIGIFARPTVGKTWMVCWQACLAWLNGYKVVIYSPEMPAEQLALRCDVIMAALNGHPISYRMLIRGEAAIEDSYRRLVEHFRGERLWIYDSIDGRAASVTDIGVLMRQHRPDVSMVDGLSLLRQEGRTAAVWEQVKDTSYALKSLTTSNNSAIIVSHQAVRAIPKGGDEIAMPSLKDAAFGDAFVQACSTVITMALDRNQSYLRWYSIQKSRERSWEDEIPVRMPLFWNVDAGIIEDFGRFGTNQAMASNEANIRMNRQIRNRDPL